MDAREGMIVGSVLLAICFLASAATHALEAAQPSVSVTTSSELPAFLDDDRLPALEEAWRASEQPPESETPQSALPDTTSSATEAAGEANTVRERAEALSRRFGAATGPAAQKTPPPVTIAPAVVPEPASEPNDPPTLLEVRPGSAQTAITVMPVIPARKSAMHAAKTDANAAIPAMPTETASTESDFSSEKLRLAAPPPPPESIPPLPRRAPTSRSEDGVETEAVVTHPKAARTYSASTTVTNPAAPPPDPMAALRGSILTNDLRAFGWNSQPK